MEVICEYDAILNEGLEHARILVSEGVLEPALRGFSRRNGFPSEGQAKLPDGVSILH